MAIIKLFSRRQKELRGDIPDTLTYNDLPNSLRVQIVHILRDAFGTDKKVYGHYNRPEAAFDFIHKALCREYGVFKLGNRFNNTDEECVTNHLLTTDDVESAIDVIELCFKYIDRVIKVNLNDYTYCTNIQITPEAAIQELNDRFKEHGIGYKFESSIIKIDSTYAHSEIVKPTLSLLINAKFSGANEEYLKAHEHYRHGRNKECLNDCLKAFESTIKIICTEKSWGFNPTDTANKLIQICFQNNLVPSFTQNQFSSLQNLLASGIPTIRNKLGGHGQGQTPQIVDDEMTRYALNLTGTNIIFLVEQSGIQ